MNRRKLPPLKSLPAFIAVAEHLSFSQAAKTLSVTHSAISQSVKSLETFIGHRLFNREGGKISLTKAGQAYYTEIQAALNNIEGATQRLLGKRKLDNTLTVNVMITFSLHWLIPRLQNFQDLYPDIDLRISTIPTEINFITDHIDLEIAYGNLENYPNDYTHKLFGDQLLLTANPTLSRAKKSLDYYFKTLKAIYVTAPLRKHDWKIWCQQADIPQPISTQRIRFQSTSQAIQAAISGLGMIVTHRAFIANELKAKQLIRLSQTSASLKENYFLRCPKSHLKHKAVNDFIAWVSEQAQKSSLQ